MQDQPDFTLEQFQQQYQLQHQLGRGKFGEVRLAIHHITGHRYAVKLIHCSNARQAGQVQQEIQIINELDHPRIIKLERHYRKQYAKNSQRGYCSFGLVMELGICSLQQCLKDYSYRYNLEDAIRCLAQLVQIGAYLQDQGYVHRDIKPANIIITGPHLQFKMGDFGLSCHVRNRPNGFAGTLHYCSPRLKQFYQQTKHDNKNRTPLSNAFKDDVYSLGVTILQVFQRIGYKSGNYQLDSLLREMMEKEEKYRPDFLHLKENQVIKNRLGYGSQNQKIEEDVNVFRKVELRENKMPDLELETLKKINQCQRQDQNCFTQVQGPRLFLRQQFFPVDFRPRTAVRISQRYILCGCQAGQLVIFDILQKIPLELTLAHQKYVCKVALDQRGDVWTAGGDGHIYYIQLDRLLDCIHNNHEIKQLKQKKGIYQLLPPVQKHFVRLQEDDYQIIHKISDRKEITQFFCLRKDRFAVGYSDGMVHVTWEDRKIQVQNHMQVVTVLKIFGDYLYACFFSGNMIRIDLKTLKKDVHLFKFSDTPIDLLVSPLRLGIYNLQSITYSGTIQKIQMQQRRGRSCCEQLIIRNVMGAVIFNNQWLTLTSEGTLFHGNQEMLSSDFRRGWMELSERDGWLVGCSIDGMLLVAEMYQ